MGWRDWGPPVDSSGGIRDGSFYGPVTGFAQMNSNGSNITVNLSAVAFGTPIVVSGFLASFPANVGATTAPVAGTVTIDQPGWWAVEFAYTPQDVSVQFQWREFIMRPRLNGVPIGVEDHWNSLRTIPLLSARHRVSFRDVAGPFRIYNAGDVLDFTLEHQVPPLTGGALGAPTNGGIVQLNDPIIVLQKYGRSNDQV